MIEIFYVEDDESTSESVKSFLEQFDCKVTILATITAAKQCLLSHQPDIILLDWNMPDGQGDLLCEWIRHRFKELPLIFLTARGDSHDIVVGFQTGADDYVTKPFDLDVLYSRIFALWRRTKQIESTILYCDQISLDLARMSVFCNHKETLLSQPEYQILLLLMKGKGKTITRKQLLEQVWDTNGNYVNDNTLTVTMKRLREKLCNPPCIKTIRSFGYRMEDSL